MNIKEIIFKINEEINSLHKNGIVKSTMVKEIVNKNLNIFEAKYKRPVSYSGINAGYGLRVVYNSKFVIIDGEKKKTFTEVKLSIFSECKDSLKDIEELNLTQFKEFCFLIAPRGIYYPAKLDKYIELAKKV